MTLICKGSDCFQSVCDNEFRMDTLNRVLSRGMSDACQVSDGIMVSVHDISYCMGDSCRDYQKIANIRFFHEGQNLYTRILLPFIQQVEITDIQIQDYDHDGKMDVQITGKLGETVVSCLIGGGMILSGAKTEKPVD